jgi:all-trans-retinol 13,14-reductase
LFDFLSDGKLEWAPMDAEYDRFYIGDKTFSAIAGKQAFRDNLIANFPEEEQAIDRYLDLLTEVSAALGAHGMGRVLKPWQRAIGSPLLKWRTPSCMYRNTYAVLSELTENQDLIAVLCGQWGDMGLPPKQSAFMAHAMIARHYLYGGYYPVGGSWHIAESVIPKIQQTGGEVFTYARVKEILVEDGSINGVEMEDGHRIDCSCVISSAGVDNTFRHLLPHEVVKTSGYVCLYRTEGIGGATRTTENQFLDLPGQRLRCGSRDVFAGQGCTVPRGLHLVPVRQGPRLSQSASGYGDDRDRCTGAI